MNLWINPGATTGSIISAFILLIISSLWLTDSFAENKNVDVILLMDSSGSMKRTDPEKLRAPAAKLLVSLLGPSDRTAIVSFSDEGYPVAYLTSNNSERNKNKLFAAIDKISTRGVFTNLSGAVATAIKVFKRNPSKDRKRVVVLMSDGKIDMGDNALSEKLKNKLLNEQIPELKSLGITLSTIAFTENSDKTLMKQLAKMSGGTFYLANTDKSLRGAYTAIFEHSKAPNQIPFNADKFLIDVSVSETTVIGTKSSKSANLTLHSPNNKQYTKKSINSDMTWFTSDTFDLITIKKPVAGTWKLTSSDGDNKAYIVSDQQLYVEFEPHAPIIGDGVVIKAWLQSGDKIISNKEIIDGVHINLAALTPEGVTHQLEMEPYSQYTDDANSAGIFASHIAFPTVGQFQISVTFKSNTFAREKVVFIHVEAAAAKETQPAEAVIAQAELDSSKQNTPTKHAPSHTESDSHKQQVTTHDSIDTNEKHSETTVEHTPLIGNSGHETKGIELPIIPPIVASAGHTTINPIAGDQAPATHAETDKPTNNSKQKKDKDHDASAKGEHTESHDEDSGTSTAIMVFLGINVFLIAGGIGGYFIYKRRKSKSKINQGSENNDEPDESDEIIDLSDDTEEDADERKVA